MAFKLFSSTLIGCGSAITTVAVHPKSSGSAVVAVGAADGNIHILSVEAPSQIIEQSSLDWTATGSLGAVRFSNDGKSLFAFSFFQGTVYVATRVFSARSFFNATFSS